MKFVICSKGYIGQIRRLFKKRTKEHGRNFFEYDLNELYGFPLSNDQISGNH